VNESSCHLELVTYPRKNLTGFNEWMNDPQFSGDLSTAMAEEARDPTMDSVVWGYVALFVILLVVTLSSDYSYLHHYRRFFLWPLLSIILNVVLAVALCQYDHRRWYERKVGEPIAVRLTLERLNDTSLPLLLPDTHTWKRGFKWIIRDCDRARELLSMLGSTSINVVVLTFSVTILALQLSASNYSPRLVNSYMRSSANVRCLSVFIGFFAYCMTVTFFVGGEAPGEQEEDPFTPE